MARRLGSGELVDLNGEVVSVLGLGRGAITEEEWIAIATGLVASGENVAREIPEGPVDDRYRSARQPCVVEVGVLSGKTTKALYGLMGRLRWSGCTLFAIDKDPSCKERLLANFGGRFRPDRATQNHLVFRHGTTETVFGGIMLPETSDEVRFAFIDGCHCYDCVATDIRVLARFTAPGSVFAFHDAGNQRSLNQEVHERYHGDGVRRLYGVTEAIRKEVSSGVMQDWDLIQKVYPWVRDGDRRTMGGVEVWQRR